MNEAENNMFDELFINKEVFGDWQAPCGAEDELLKKVYSGRNNKEKVEALFAWSELRRHDSIKNSGKFCEPDLGETIRTIHALDKELGQNAGLVLFQVGDRSEALYDYESAAAFYEASLACKMHHPDGRYWSLNNLAFCLNFMRCFEKAEGYLKEAIFIKFLRYNAWKNLGVSLEHQGEVDRAAECYVQAITCSNSEERSFAHFRRLLDRYPALSKTYVKIRSGKNEE